MGVAIMRYYYVRYYLTEYAMLRSLTLQVWYMRHCPSITAIFVETMWVNA